MYNKENQENINLNANSQDNFNLLLPIDELLNAAAKPQKKISDYSFEIGGWEKITTNSGTGSTGSIRSSSYTYIYQDNTSGKKVLLKPFVSFTEEDIRSERNLGDERDEDNKANIIREFFGAAVERALLQHLGSNVVVPEVSIVQSIDKAKWGIAVEYVDNLQTVEQAIKAKHGRNWRRAKFSYDVYKEINNVISAAHICGDPDANKNNYGKVINDDVTNAVSNEIRFDFGDFLSSAFMTSEQFKFRESHVVSQNWPLEFHKIDQRADVYNSLKGTDFNVLGVIINEQANKLKAVLSNEELSQITFAFKKSKYDEAFGMSSALVKMNFLTVDELANYFSSMLEMHLNVLKEMQFEKQNKAPASPLGLSKSHYSPAKNNYSTASTSSESSSDDEHSSDHGRNSSGDDNSDSLGVNKTLSFDSDSDANISDSLENNINTSISSIPGFNNAAENINSLSFSLSSPNRQNTISSNSVASNTAIHLSHTPAQNRSNETKKRINFNTFGAQTLIVASPHSNIAGEQDKENADNSFSLMLAQLSNSFSPIKPSSNSDFSPSSNTASNSSNILGYISPAKRPASNMSNLNSVSKNLNKKHMALFSTQPTNFR